MVSLARPVLVLLVMLMAMTAGAGTAQADDGGAVSSFRVDAAHTGVMPGPGPTSAPEVKWKFGVQDYFLSSPAVVDGVV